MRRHAKASSAGSTSGQAGGFGSPRLRILALLCLAVAAAMTLFASSAFAAKIHPYTGTSFGPDGAAGSESFTAVQGVAVDQTSGDVYVFDGGVGKLFKFDAGGEPADFSSLGTNAIGGITAFGNGENEVAVAPAGAPGGTAGDIYIANGAGIQVFDPSGKRLESFVTGVGEVCGVATDPAGHVFAGIYPSEVKEFTPMANPPVTSDQTGVSSAELPTICGVAADGLGNVYATGYFEGGEGAAKLEGLTDPTATIVAPSSRTIAVDPASNDLYANNAGSISQYDSDGNLIGTFGAEQLSGSYGVGVNGTSEAVYASTGSGTVAIFGAPIVAPGVSTEAATAVTVITATLNGTVSPDNVAVSECKFEYGLTTAYGQSKPCEGAIPTDGNDHPVTAALTGLNTGSEYHFRIVATNANGTSKGADRTFTTKQPAITGEATEVEGTRATLNGTVLPEGEAVTSCFFEYGAGQGYGKTAPCVGAIPTDEGEHAVTAALTHLAPDFTTHFRLVINRGGPPIRGVDQSFRTSATVTTGPASAITGGTAAVEGTINPEGIALTTCSFEYGATITIAEGAVESYEDSVPCTESPASIGTGTGPVAVHANLSGLAFGATYHYRLVATNVDGSSAGEDQKFTTPGAAIKAELAASVGLSEATLQVQINPHGSATTYRIEYGTDTSYGAATPEAPIGAGEVSQTFENTLTGLTPATTYHWRVVATNSIGTSLGADHTFTTYVPSPAPETDCPNQAFRSGPSADLPDCRAYEQATPVDKNGANVQGDVNFVQASAAGNRITFADAAGLPTSGGSSTTPVYLASRGADSWTSNGLLPLTRPGERAGMIGWDDEIATAASSAGGGGIFFADTASGSFQLAAPTPRGAFPSLAGFAADTSHLVLQSARVLTPGAIGPNPNLYDLDHGTLSLVGRVPTVGASSCDDATGPACVASPVGSFASPTGTVANSISKDGSKVFFMTSPDPVRSGQLYVREDGTRTTQISASQASTPDPNGSKPATFLMATADGSKAFFASCEKLTDDSTAVSTAAEACSELVLGRDETPEQGQDLYSYDTASDELTDLTVDPNVGDRQRAGFVGLAGISADGSYVYFAANGVLAPGAAPGNCAIGPGEARLGSCSLYLSHAGTTTLVARLNSGSDYFDWESGSSGHMKESRVAADGTLLFRSSRSLTGYANTWANSDEMCAEGATRCPEIYRYTPAGEELRCISCDPTGAAPTGVPTLETHRFIEGGPSTELLTRNISPDGNRVFFDSPDPLVPADTNGVVDPYEWEAGGTGSCHSADVNGGCLYLLSSGKSLNASYLGDVSASGDDAFIFTGQSLVPQDEDELVDVYDVRVDGGLASQHPETAAPPCLGEACRGASSAASGQPSPGSAGFSGPGDKKEKPKQKKCQKHGKTKCKKHKKHSKKSKKQKKSGGKKTRGANSNRGGSK